MAAAVFSTVDPTSSREMSTPARIWEAPGSNLGPKTGYSDRSFSGLFLVLTGKCCDKILNWSRPLSSVYFPIYHSLMTQRYCYRFLA
jgi:hypothetical protein